MRRIIIIIIILLAIFISGCQNKKTTGVDLTLSVVEKNNCFFLNASIKNNTRKKIYIPRPSNVLDPGQLNIYNKKDKNRIDNMDYMNEEIRDQLSRFGHNIVTIQEFCADCEFIPNRIVYLDLPPYTERKDRVKRVIDSELRRYIVSNKIQDLPKNDLDALKEMIFIVYYDCVFLDPGDIYNNCFTINTLVNSDIQYEVSTEFNVMDTTDFCNYPLEYTDDTITISAKLLDEIDGYQLFNQHLISNKLTIGRNQFIKSDTL